MTILSILKNNKVGILGGDVISIDGDSYKFTYDNWHCDSSLGESTSDFVQRSYKKALDYLKSYPLKDNKELIYSITCKDLVVSIED